MACALRQLSVDDGFEIFEMLKRIKAKENSFTNPVNKMSYSEYRKWLFEQDCWSQGRQLPDGYVGQTIFWLLDDEVPVGFGKIRHALTETSRVKGGNIGYAIDPNYRGRGYGSKILELLLAKACEMNINELLLTVDKFNYASKRIIEKNGGMLTGENDERWFFTFR